MDTNQRGLRVRAFSALVAMAAFFLLFTPHAARAGGDDNVFGWLWSGTVGWISLNCEQTDLHTCTTQDYGVTMEDILNSQNSKTGWAMMSGWAWSENVGWVCFGGTCEGTTPEGVAPYVEYRDTYQYDDGVHPVTTLTDQVFGWIQIVGLGDDGWISLNCADMDTCGTSDYHVTLDSGAGRFTKHPPPEISMDSWAWGAAKVDRSADWWSGAGWVDFSKAETTWTLAKLEGVLRPEGIYEPLVENPIGTHLTTFKIRFPGLFASRKCLIECDVRTPPHDGSPSGDLVKVQRVLGTTVRGGYYITDNPLAVPPPPLIDVEHTILPTEYIDPNLLWRITSCRIGGFPSSTACTSDEDCGAAAKYFCDSPDGTTAGRCRLRLREKIRFLPIYTHPISSDPTPRHQWTILEDEGEITTSDQYEAMRCNEGSAVGKYFNNATVCDFRADASYTLLMRRGITFETDCTDGVDNDGNGLTDCAEPYCKGISYFSCGTQEHVNCEYGTGGVVPDCDDPGYTAGSGSLCCTRLNKVVDGFECEYDDGVDDYHDCTDSAYQYPDLCCSEDSEVVKLPTP